MRRPRAADDFAAIRARIEELQRERASVSADLEPSSDSAPGRASGARPAPTEKPATPSPLRQVWPGMTEEPCVKGAPCRVSQAGMNGHLHRPTHSRAQVGL